MALPSTSVRSGTTTFASVMDDPGNLSRLLAAAESGDQAAWNEIVNRFTNLLWSVCRSFRLHDDQAIDVVQTTWLRLVENLGKIHDPERLAGWLATTARRECLRLLRRSGREDVGWTDTTVPTVLDDDALTRPESADVGVDLRLLTDERDKQLWRCFSRLPERCQRLLRVLMATETNAYAEVSAALGLPIGSIGPTRMRCLTRLRELATEAGYGFLATNEGVCNGR
jgi:RNA polymerase sigma factor (sigma-70 family)